MILWLFILLMAPGGAFAEDLKPVATPPKVSEDSPPTPVISESGFKRIKGAVKEVSQNIVRAEENSHTIEKNIHTLEGELKELDKLEEEHKELRKKHDRYLSYSAVELKKNAEGLKELEDWEKTAKNTPHSESAELTAKLNAVQQEKLKRKSWETDARQKIERVNAVGRGLDTNLLAIEKKRPELSAQLDYWKSEQTRHQDLLKILEQRRKEMEELGKQSQ